MHAPFTFVAAYLLFFANIPMYVGLFLLWPFLLPLSIVIKELYNYKEIIKEHYQFKFINAQLSNNQEVNLNRMENDI